ncbi:isochorismatase family protein [Sporosarcina sp. Sa2YVA2]|uniref:Isochorismatase family protein n=1 Tax=Sporosarcina quadrami TaxID=2762234 RepID=A0ABR8UCA9_9BACL|nr:isochorismatase family protein [Sporosarcina quadrami]MBD7985659.1 isochorismatase family protein [Sporosarcina quadrami]
MKALLVIDFQNGFLQMGDYNIEKEKVENLAKDFRRNKQPVIFIRHKDENSESPIADGSEGGNIDSDLVKYADNIIEKSTPSAFFKTNLQEILQSLGVNHVFVTGFNTEYCPQFTAIAAYDRGFQVTFIEDATATVNDESTYEFPGLDIRDFVGSVLYWSNVIDVLNYEEYVEEYVEVELKS